MPCYDGRDHEPKVVYRTGIDPELLDEEKNNYKRLEAAVCAICNELSRRGILTDVLAEASRFGLIDLSAFYKAHVAEDVAKIAIDINRRYSKDELAVIKELLSKTDLKTSVGG